MSGVPSTSICVAARRSEGDVDTVGERDGLEDGAEFVVAVGPLVEYAKAEVQFGESRDASRARHRRHLSYWSREKTS